MSELRERQWSVISERGREASSVPYEEASHLVRELASNKVRGLCIVTDAAAERLARNQQPVNSAQSPPT